MTTAKKKGIYYSKGMCKPIELFGKDGPIKCAVCGRNVVWNPEEGGIAFMDDLMFDGQDVFCANCVPVCVFGKDKDGKYQQEWPRKGPG